jgi:hypothetical protein
MMAIIEKVGRARYYDGGIIRWLTPDPLADKYHGWSPYNYVLGNPLRYVDPDGMEIDDSELDEEDRKRFYQLIEQLKKSERFSEVWETLVSSNAIYKIVSIKDGFTSYSPNSFEKGAGGVLNIVGMGIPTLTHEMYHAYQHDQMNLIRSFGIEIEAFLFSEAISYEFSTTALTGLSPGTEFGKYYHELLFSKDFNDNAWRGAINTFKDSHLYVQQRYGHLNPIYYQNPLIKNFYPLIK